MHNYPVGVLGASGYVGRELCALVAGHPALSLAFATAQSQRGESARLGGRDVAFIAPDDADLGSAALVFSALPHGASYQWVARAREAGAKVVDLSADLRPGNPGHAHQAGAGVPAPGSVPYGLPELMRDQVRGSALVANPGCYPTAILLALAPVVARGLAAAGATITVAAASGVTGAGFAPRQDLMFAEVENDFRAYSAGNTHRHLDEMRAVLAALGGDQDLLFTPHLLPVSRGILATLTVPLAAPLADPAALYREAYRGEPFVEIADVPPSLRDVAHRNVARIWVATAAHVRRPTLQIIAAIDNLVKGAAGQAMQNANLLLGLDEPMGLPA
jgi:N-acetyl-gamma-glutamyl-phosphate reductase